MKMKIQCFLMFIVALTLSGCGNSEGSSQASSFTSHDDSTETTSSIVEPSSYIEDEVVTKFNEIIDYNYSSFYIRIITKKGESSLQSTYEIKKDDDGYNVDYTKQKYALFDLSIGITPEEMIITETGSFKTDNPDYNIKMFKFAPDIYKTFTFDNGMLKATIDNAKDYLKVDYDCLLFEITFKYSTMLSEIKMSYFLADNTLCTIIFDNFSLL